VEKLRGRNGHPMISFLSTIRSGFVDSLNPGGLAMFLWYGVYLVAVAGRGGNIARLGLWFIAGVFLLRFLFAFCILDRFLFSRGFNVFLDVSYFIFAVLAIIGGALFWRRWCILRRQPPGESQEIPFFPSGTRKMGQLASGWITRVSNPFCKKEGCPREIFLNPAFGLALGIFLGLMQTAWAPDEYITRTTAQIPFPANWVEHLSVVSVYATAFVTALFFLLFVVTQLQKSEEFQRWRRRSRSLVSAASAAVWLAYGISFLTYYF
jgi:hypothetical protein